MKAVQAVVCVLCLGVMACGPQEPGGETGEVGFAQFALLPSAPAELIATPIRGGVHLDWPAVSGATYYQVYKGTSSGNYSWHSTATTNSFDDDTTKLRYYVVIAGNASGEGAASPEATARGWANVAIGRPATQSTNYDPNLGLAGNAVDGNVDGDWWSGSVSSTSWGNAGQFQWWRVDFGSKKSVYFMDIWNRTDCCSDELSNYDIDYSNDDTPTPTNWVTRAHYDEPAGRPTTAGLMPITARHVRIQRKTADRALMLAEVQVWGTPVDTTPPSAPTNLTATPISSSRIQLSWGHSNDNVGVLNYIVERCTGASCSYFHQIANPQALTYVSTGLDPHTTYCFRVLARDYSSKFGDFSNTACATTTF